MNISRVLLPISLLFTTMLYPLKLTFSEQDKSQDEKEVVVSFQLQPNESVLKQTIKVSIDSPNAKLTQTTFSQNPTKQYLPEFKDSKDVFNANFSIKAHIQSVHHDNIHPKLHISFLPLPTNKMEERVFALSFDKASETMPEQIAPDQKNLHKKQSAQSKPSWVESLQDMVQTTDSNWIRLLFAFLLGLLLSLTPCIYPMIPITIGILHRHGKKSFLHNFLGSLCYAVGLSTTFAVLGLLAAFAGASFGGLLSQPIFVIILTLFIGFMSLTMIGIVEMPIPSFMQGNTEVSSSRFGPFLSAFFFGILSGTIASPCVSPGLALLLTIVATIGNIFAGFLLLFAFGIGMSTPLIAIGTFSTSLQMLPQAGQWMVEIKKLLGFVMLATCFYYLSNIMPTYMVMWLLVAYLLFASLFYIIDAQQSFDDKGKTVKSLIGIILLALTVFTSFKAYETTYHKPSVSNKKGVTWAQDYATGLQQAKEQNKLLIVDFWANHCTICKAIERKIFDKQLVADQLHSKAIFVKVDCTSNSNQESVKLKEQYKVFAQPTILVINPHNETVLKKWSSEPYKMTPQEFADTIKNIN